jgi:hypothetical protein
MAAKMALVSEPSTQSYVNRSAAIPEHLFCPIDPDLHQVGVGWHAHVLPKGAQKMKRAEPSNR